MLSGKRVMVNSTCRRRRQNKANFRAGSNGRRPARLPVPPVGPSVRNEANSRRRRVGRGLGDEGRGLLYKQTQFAHPDADARGAAKSPAEPLPGPMAPNKPNFAGAI